MSVNMNEDESEVAEGFTRVLRTAMMGSMQVREGMEGIAEGLVDSRIYAARATALW